MIRVPGLAMNASFASMAMTVDLEEQLRAVLEAQPYGVIVLGLGGVILSASSRAEKLMRRALPGGTRLADVLDEAVVTTGETDTAGLMRGVEIGFDEIALWLKAEPAPQRPGIEAVVSVVDVTPLRGSLDERTSSLRFLLHDLRSPLNSIVALTQLEAGDPAAFDSCGGMSKISDLARYVLSLGEQFLVSSIATHVANKDFRRFDLRAMMRQIIPQLEVTGVHRGVPLQLWLPDSSAVWVCGVRNFLARAFQNVVDNAIHASPAGEPVTVQLKTRDGFADIVITDRAGGLPGVREPQLVTDFDSLTRSGAAGFGLGLKLARQIVELHGGSLSAESAPGIGTSFVLSIPLLTATPASRVSVSLEDIDQALTRRANH